jgi:hypothetical protein
MHNPLEKIVRTATRIVLATAILASASCTDLFSEKIIERRPIRSYTGSQGEQVTLIEFKREGNARWHRQADIIYPDSLHLRIIDELRNGTIDRTYLVNNPHHAQLVRVYNGEPLVIVSEDSLRRYVQ